MAEYRSEFLQVWVVGGEVTTDELASALGDLEHAARSAEVSVDSATDAAALPLALRQFFAGLAFLREHLWAGIESGAPGLAGLLLHEGRLWALRAGVPATLDQLTGAPAPVVWHEPAPGSALTWCEVDPTEVWRLEFSGPEGALSVHHRPALVSVLGTLRDEALADSSTPTADPADEPDTAGADAPARPTVRLASPRRAAPRVVKRAAPAWRPTRTQAAIAAGVALVAAVALVFLAREPVSRALVGRYDLAVATHPAGATVRVDGELVPGRTPLTVALEPGEHRVELQYGEYASAVFNVDGDRGATVQKNVAWTGSLGLASADTTAKLRVSFDGKPWGALPLWRDDVPVGRHRLSFQGEGVRPWEEEVKIKAGQSTRVSAEPVRVPDYGLVTARAERVSSDGVEDVEGASVFVDGRPAGATPLDLKLAPGPHSVRVAAGGELGPVHLIDVQAGGRFYASTTFGRAAEPAVAFDAPARISLAAPPLLVARLAADVPLPVRSMRLFVARGAAGAFTDTDFAVANDDGRPKGAVRFPTAGLAAGQSVRYYVEIETREGEEFFSEVRTVAVVP